MIESSVIVGCDVGGDDGESVGIQVGINVGGKVLECPSINGELVVGTDVGTLVPTTASVAIISNTTINRIIIVIDQSSC